MVDESAGVEEASVEEATPGEEVEEEPAAEESPSAAAEEDWDITVRTKLLSPEGEEQEVEINVNNYDAEETHLLFALQRAQARRRRTTAEHDVVRFPHI
jgi:hypothetical protein